MLASQEKTNENIDLYYNHAPMDEDIKYHLRISRIKQIKTANQMY